MDVRSGHGDMRGDVTRGRHFKITTNETENNLEVSRGECELSKYITVAEQLREKTWQLAAATNQNLREDLGRLKCGGSRA